MARTRVTVIGLGRLQRELGQLGDRIHEGAAEAVQEAAEAVRDEARDAVRVDTGALRRGLKAFVRESDLEADIGWRDPDLYYARYQEFGTSKISANPALTAAGEAERTRFPDRVAEDVRREIGG